ncbi:MAG: hypothetical protein WDN08_17845 [Rhizomicrobium sp.]
MTKEDIRRQFQSNYIPQYFEVFRAVIGDYQQHAYINPVLRVLEIASRNEAGGDRARAGLAQRPSRSVSWRRSRRSAAP